MLSSLTDLWWVGGSEKFQNYADVMYGWFLRKNFRSATWRLLTCKGGADADQQRKTIMMSTYTSVRRTHSNNVTMNKTFDSNGISIDNRSG